MWAFTTDLIQQFVGAYCTVPSLKREVHQFDSTQKARSAVHVQTACLTLADSPISTGHGQSTSPPGVSSDEPVLISDPTPADHVP